MRKERKELRYQVTTWISEDMYKKLITKIKDRKSNMAATMREALQRYMEEEFE